MAQEAAQAWTRVEHWALILTFLCTLVGTIYAVKTARHTMAQMNLDYRPWISLPAIETGFEQDQLLAKVQIENIGKVPAFARVIAEAQSGDNAVAVGPSHDPVVLMPGQLIRYRAFSLRGETYKAILSRAQIPPFRMKIRVEYGPTAAEVSAHSVSQTVRFNPERLPDTIPSGQTNIRLWDLEASSIDDATEGADDHE